MWCLWCVSGGCFECSRPQLASPHHPDHSKPNLLTSTGNYSGKTTENQHKKICGTTEQDSMYPTAEHWIQNISTFSAKCSILYNDNIIFHKVFQHCPYQHKNILISEWCWKTFQHHLNGVSDAQTDSVSGFTLCCSKVGAFTLDIWSTFAWTKEFKQ